MEDIGNSLNIRYCMSHVMRYKASCVGMPLNLTVKIKVMSAFSELNNNINIKNQSQRKRC